MVLRLVKSWWFLPSLGVTAVVVLLLSFTSPVREYLIDVGTFWGAFVGLIALGVVAMLNADLNRERDNQLQAADRRTIAVALNAEIDVVVTQLRSVAVNANYQEQVEILTTTLVPLGLSVRTEQNVGMLGSGTSRELVRWFLVLEHTIKEPPPVGSFEQAVTLLIEVGEALVEITGVIIENNGKLPTFEQIVPFVDAIVAATGKMHGHAGT